MKFYAHPLIVNIQWVDYENMEKQITLRYFWLVQQWLTVKTKKYFLTYLHFILLKNNLLHDRSDHQFSSKQEEFYLAGDSDIQTNQKHPFLDCVCLIFFSNLTNPDIRSRCSDQRLWPYNLTCLSNTGANLLFSELENSTWIC